MGNNGNSNKLKSTSISEAFAAADRAEAAKKRRRNVPLMELEVAFAVLLVDLASCDQQFAPREYLAISSGLRRLFGTPKERVKALVNQANIILANLRGTSRYAALLKNNLDMEEKTAVMETIDELISVDGIEDGFEVYLRTKVADLLGMPTELPSSPPK